MCKDNDKINDVVDYFKSISETYDILKRGTTDDLAREYYKGKAEAYKIAAYELEQVLL